MRLHFWSSARNVNVVVVLALALAGPVLANERDKTKARGRDSQLLRVNLDRPDGQILSYRHLAGPMDVLMRGTNLAKDAQVRLKIGSRPGFVELDINRGGITGLKPAHRLGRDFLTYVLWAVSVDGRASNLGEITFAGDQAVPVNVTTPYQTFWVMVTAEPNYAVVDPSTRIVLYSVKQPTGGAARALEIPGNLFYFTHYGEYESVGVPRDAAPNQLLQARKALELASKAGVLASPKPSSDPTEDSYTRAALSQARSYLKMAEEAYTRDPKSQEVVQFARTSAQSAENARALALGAVGGLMIRQLEAENDQLRAELARLRPGVALPSPAPPEAAEAARKASSGLSGVATITPMRGVAVPLVQQPALWFAVAGWVVAIVVLFRRRSV